MARVALEAKPLVDHPSIGTCVRARRVVGPSGDIEDGDDGYRIDAFSFSAALFPYAALHK